MEPADPPPLKHAGDAVFPDVLSTLPEQLMAITAFAWIVLVPVWIAVAVRRGRGRAAVLAYAGGAFLAAIFFTQQSGTFGEPLAHRWGIWAEHIWLPLFAAASVLGLAGVSVGRMLRRSTRAAP
ncbi:hypothetical protein [Phenylobacterium sp.]|jgi:hypothetical protein|uniref:hypothetical protein n=1 Tax=Phenylobacterium sp. TaxID=1871053 RepID=UPI002F94F749